MALKAHVLIRTQPWYRRSAFCTGLKRAGLAVVDHAPVKPNAETLLVIWNRYAGNHDIATQVEKAGGTVWVAENGYLGALGTSPKFDVHPGGPKAHHYYALARGYHNGRGTWPDGDGSRFAQLGVELKPWRTEGEHILICPNRSFGVGAQVMHPDWATRSAERIRKHTQRKVIIRSHPGNDAPRRTLSADLENAWACVVWSSGAAVHALAAGIPTYIEAPWQVVKGAGAMGHIDSPACPERLPVFERMAWAQWSVAEIESGEAARHLLSTAGQGALA